VNVFTRLTRGMSGDFARHYERKAQAMTYDGQRACSRLWRNKYTSTGVIQWMLTILALVDLAPLRLLPVPAGDISAQEAMERFTCSTATTSFVQW